MKKVIFSLIFSLLIISVVFASSIKIGARIQTKTTSEQLNKIVYNIVNLSEAKEEEFPCIVQFNLTFSEFEQIILPSGWKYKILDRFLWDEKKSKKPNKIISIYASSKSYSINQNNMSKEFIIVFKNNNNINEQVVQLKWENNKLSDYIYFKNNKE